MIKELLKFKHSEITRDVNYVKIPCTAFQMNDDGAHKFNKIFKWVKSQEFKQIVRNRSNGISIERRNFKPPMWDIRATKSLIEMTIVMKEGCWRFQFRTIPKHTEKHDNNLYGTTSFKIFKQKCLEFGIDLDDYAISNGEEVKKEIEKPLIKLERDFFANKTFENVHHLDFHSSYPAGLMNTHPEFKEAIKWMYDHRKDNNGKWKLILNASIGYMQSVSCCGAKWANLSKDAINDNNRRIREIAEKLKASGNVIIAYNTDGIWYHGDIYHDENEGSTIGTWGHDHLNCKFRAKSAGSYEFIEDNIYQPVVRGFTRLDTVKNRSDWQWGDIYCQDAAPLVYYFTEEGIKRDGNLI